MRRLRVLAAALLIAGLSSGCTLYGWGGNDRGQVGDGTRLLRDEPVPAAVNPGWIVSDAGPAHTCAINDWRRLLCWGSGSQAQLGLGATPLGVVNALLDLANGLEILTEFRAIARTKRLLETGHFLRHGIENGAGPTRLRQPLGRRTAVAE